jgi:CRP-like cAMP-binding protein
MSSSNALVTMRAFTREDDVISLKSGEVLFRPGETGTTMFGLLEGAIRIT